MPGCWCPFQNRSCGLWRRFTEEDAGMPGASVCSTCSDKTRGGQAQLPVPKQSLRPESTGLPLPKDWEATAKAGNGQP